MGVWSDRRFSDVLIEMNEQDAWKVDEKGETQAISHLIRALLRDVEEPNSLPHNVFTSTRKLANEVLVILRDQTQLNIPSPVVHHIKNAALCFATAGVLQPTRGSLDKELNDIAIDNFEWTREVVRRLHVIGVMRLVQAFEEGEGATGF